MTATYDHDSRRTRYLPPLCSVPLRANSYLARYQGIYRYRYPEYPDEKATPRGFVSTHRNVRT
eukprot:1423917-Rhodomonas_salina.1